jgi:uncharacterized protein YndB with AHSA1/START domain
MTERNVTHADFTLERTYDAPPSRVFNAFADPEVKATWFSGPDGWESLESATDFRVGGRDIERSRREGEDTVHAFECVYWDIIPDARIVYTYDMHLDDQRISVSLATLEFKPEGNGTRLMLTEHGAFLDGVDNVDLRQSGTAWLLDNLGKALSGQPASAS